MSGMFAHNKLFETYCMTGRENLPYLEDDVFADESVITTVLEDYEISLEDDWSDFIKDFCL